ncbi:MAG: SpvB/TcaC N-terminal domain-containing protein, partial [Nitrospirota bacterium]
MPALFKKLGALKLLSITAVVGAVLLGTFAVFGGLTSSDAVKLNPMGLSIDSSGAWVEDSAAWSLMDRDTSTVYAPTANVTDILVTLPKETDLSALKVYGSASFDIKVYEDTTGAWKLIPGLDVVSLKSQSEAWNTFKPSGTARVSRVMIELTKASGPQTGIKEIEIWGSESGDPTLSLDGLQSAADVQAVLAATPRPAHLMELAAPSGTIDVPADGNGRSLTFTLQTDPRLVRRAYLLYDAYNADYLITPEKRINGLSWTGGFSTQSAAPQWVSHFEEISPAWLVKGENKIEFRNLMQRSDPASYFVRDLKVIVELENGWNAVSTVTAADGTADATYDGDTATYYKLSGVHTIDIKTERTAQPQTVKLNLWSATGSLSGTLALQYQQGSLWKNFTSGGTFDLSTLHDGWNEITVPQAVSADALRLSFNVTPDRRRPGAVVGGVTELRLIASPVGSRPGRGLVIAYPTAGEYFGRTAHIQGFVEPAGTASIEGKTSSNTDGAISLSLTKDETRFASQADNDAWEAVVTTSPGGVAANRTIALTRNLGNTAPTHTEDSSQAAASSKEKYSEKVSPGQAKKIQYKGVTLDIPEGAVDVETEITIIPLAEADLNLLNPGMINVTYPDAGYRFLPAGMKFKKPIKISFGYSKQLFAAAQTDDEVNMYYYDETYLRWVALKRTKVDAAVSTVESESDHFTDIINSTLVVPEHPQALSFNPNSLKDIKAADPSAGMDLIEPPRANNTGTANLSYPIEIPKGRGAYTPDLRITYSSNNANGWMGLGWDIPIPSIQVDTKWGVPAYDGTEAYLLDGAPLADMGSGNYKPRVEGQYRRIKRYGAGPTGYWWEATDKNGTRYIYGKSAARNSALKNNNAGFPAVIFQWYLEQVIDTNGNSTDFFYTNDALAHQNNGEPSTQIYLDKIYYTGSGSTLGKYHADFVLESSDRPDQVVNGRSGFKTVLRKRLDRVDVYFDTSPIRSYDLEYRTGDFGKSLLSAIAVKAPGASGSLKEFYRHTLDYYSGAYGFGPVETWSTEKAQALASNDDYSYGWSLFLGIGPAPPVFHVGKGAGRGTGESNTRLVFMDVNGDGLPDRLFEDWLLDNYNGVEINQYFKGQTAFAKYPLFNSSINTLGKDKTKTATRLKGVHVGGGVASVNNSYGRSFVEGKETLADMNGDGFVDQVKLDGAVKVALNKKGEGFDSFVPWQGTISADIGLTPDEIATMKKDFHLADPVRKWVAPYGGTVRITGTVQKSAAKAGDAEDGLKVEIRQGNQLLWEQSIGADVTTAYPIDVAVSNLSAGEALYFRANSVDEITNDTVTFHPVITYDQVCTPDASGTGSTCRSVSADEAASNAAPSGSLQFVYDSAADFSLFNHREVAWEVPLDGNVTLDSSFSKQASHEDLAFRIFHYRGEEIIPVPDWEDKRFEAGESGSRSDTLKLTDVKLGDKIVFLVDNDTMINVRPDQFSWEATAAYSRHCWDPDPTNSDDQERTCKDLSQEDLDKKDPDGNPIYIFYPEIHQPVRLLAPTNTPLVSWAAPKDGAILAYGDVYKTDRTASDVFVKVQGAGAQHYQTVVDKDRYDAGDPDNNVPPSPILTPQVSVSVTAGERLFFGIHSESSTGGFVTWQPEVLFAPTQYCYAHPDTGQEVCTSVTSQVSSGTLYARLLEFCYHVTTTDQNGNQTTITVCEPVTCSAGTGASGCRGDSGASVTASVISRSGVDVNYTHVGLISEQLEAFSGGHRNWYFGEWNGNETWDTAKIKVPDKEPKETDEPEEYFMASLPKRKGLPAAPVPLWWSKGVNVYISADQMNPARLGANVTGMLNGLGASSLRLSQSFNESWSVSIIGQSINASKGDAKGRQEVMDLNGDRFADLVAENTVTLNTGTAAGFYQPKAIDFKLNDSADIRKIHNRNFQLGITYPPGLPPLNNQKSSGTTSTITTSGGVSYGLVYGNSRTDVDFIDVNGDGLPDRVAKSDDAFTVRLNLGGRFGAAESWPVPNWSQGDITPSNIPGADINSNVVASNDNIGASYMAYNVNAVRQMVMLQDINGDGLPDHLMKQDGQNIKVKFNYGGSFGPETEWQTPGWGHQIGREELKVLFGGNDALGYSGTYMLSVGFGVELTIFCIPCPLTPCVCITLDPGVNASIGYGESELQFTDIDGDGYPDHVLKQLTGNTSALYVKRNLAGKANLLKTVTRPLGGSFTLDYKKVGNIVDYSDQNNLIDMPHSQWVLISTVLDDGLAGDGTSTYTTAYDYGTPFYSRAEREFFGFNKVMETRNDGSAVERAFENHDYHKKGLQYTEILRDKPGHVWSRTENTYELRDLGAPTYQPLFPDQNYDDSHKDQLHVKFPMLTATTRHFYTGKTTDPAVSSKSTAQNFEYDDYGNINLFVDRADEGTTDDVYAAITYWIDPQDNYIVGKPGTIRVTDNSRSNVYRERKAVYQNGTGNMTELSMLIQGSTNAVWNIDYYENGNLKSIQYPAGAPSHNTKTDRYFITYQYDPQVETYVTAISDAFGYSSAADYKYEFG